MKRTSGRIGIGLVLVSMLAGACLAEREKENASTDAVTRSEAILPDARDAKEVVLAVRSQLERAFGNGTVGVPAGSHFAASRSNFDLVGLQATTNVDTLSANGFSMATPDNKAHVVLPERADGAFRLVDGRSGMAIEVGLMGAKPSAREQADGYTVYRAGYEKGAHIVHRATSQGTEDYLFFPDKLPETPELRYELALGENVAGLRLVAQTLEMLDAAGTPRLRMAPPYAVDGDGHRVVVNVAIEGCAYDTSAEMPWGRSTTLPGARHCTVHLTWDSKAKAPLIVDPAWSDTSVMKVFRMNMTATAFMNDKAIVTGGEGAQAQGANIFDSTEYYDSATSSWASGPQMPQGRAGHAAVAANDTLYLIGGRTANGATNTMDKYSFSLKSWITGTPMTKSRSGHTATLLEGFGILVAGGHDGAMQPTASAEFYRFTNFMWGLSYMAHPRVGHTATTISPTSVLVAGGEGDVESAKTLEIFEGAVQDPQPLWKLANTYFTPNGHSFHTATKLNDGRIVFAGGKTEIGAVTGAVHVYKPDGTFEPNAPAMMTPRAFFGAAFSPLAQGIIVMGGKSSNAMGAAPLNSAEVLKSGATQWEALDAMSVGRANFATLTMEGLYVVAIGGTVGVAGAPGTAELFGCSTDAECEGNVQDSYCSASNTCKPRKALGLSCDLRPAAEGGEDCFAGQCHMCQSGDCVDGVCCDGKCKEQCQACNAKGQCVPVAGSPVTNEGNDAMPKRTACIADDACGGSCNGIRVDACTYPTGNICQTGCKNGTYKSWTCVGDGTCSATPTKTELCSPYKCDDKGLTCTTVCTEAVDGVPASGCDDKSACSEGLCFPRPTSCSESDSSMMIGADGELQSCGNYRCDPDEGKCFTVCSTAYDCKVTDPKDGKVYVCDNNRQCTLQPILENTVDEVTGCSTAPANESSRFGWLAALAMAGVVVARRNRARA